jgi:hypothetical protein
MHKDLKVFAFYRLVPDTYGALDNMLPIDNSVG